MALSPEFMQDLWVRKILSTIGHTLLVYDYFLTLKDEVSSLAGMHDVESTPSVTG